jgi:hypothetical protein
VPDTYYTADTPAQLEHDKAIVETIANVGTPFFFLGSVYCGMTALARRRRAEQLEAQAVTAHQTIAAATTLQPTVLQLPEAHQGEDPGSFPITTSVEGVEAIIRTIAPEIVASILEQQRGPGEEFSERRAETA